MHTGDRGFDPLGLAKPQEYLQFDVDQLDQNKNVNKAGNLVGQFTPGVKSNNDSLAPYDDVFGLERFRETELIHGRWAMLATLGVLVGEASTGVSWSVPSSMFTAIHQNSKLSNLPHGQYHLLCSLPFTRTANSVICLMVSIIYYVSCHSPEQQAQ
jgi:hypothetical protein